MNIETQYNNIVETEEMCQTLWDVPGPDEVSDALKARAVSKIETMIFTDGYVFKIIEFPAEPIIDYHINAVRDYYKVDTLIKRHIHIQNASYIISVTVADEPIYSRKGAGIVKVIKNTEIFLNNKKDKEALKKARKTLREITETINFVSVRDVIHIPKGAFTDELEYQKIDKDTFALRREKKPNY